MPGQLSGVDGTTKLPAGTTCTVSGVDGTTELPAGTTCTESNHESKIPICIMN